MRLAAPPVKTGIATVCITAGCRVSHGEPCAAKPQLRVRVQRTSSPAVSADHLRHAASRVLPLASTLGQNPLNDGRAVLPDIGCQRSRLIVDFKILVAPDDQFEQKRKQIKPFVGQLSEDFVLTSPIA